MAAPDPTYVAIATSVSARRTPIDIPADGLDGEFGTVSVIDCNGVAIWISPVKRLLASNVGEIKIKLRTRCDCRRIWIEFTYRTVQWARQVVLLKLRIRRANIRCRNGVVNTTFNFASPAFAEALAQARLRARLLALASKRNRSLGGNPRPNPETTSGVYGRYRHDTWPPGFNYNLGDRAWIKYQRTWTGVTTPGYGSLKRGSLPVNPHSVTFRIQPDPPRMYKAVTGPYPIIWEIDTFASWGHSSDDWSILPTHKAEAYSKAVTRLVAKSGNKIVANLAQDLAQVNQTLRIITNSAARLTGSLSQLRKGNIPGAVNALWQGKKPKFRKGGGPSHLNTLATNWLELQYGWKPALQDIRGSMDSFAKFQAANKSLYSSTATGRVITETDNPLILANNYPSDLGREYSYEKSAVKIGVRFKVPDPLVAFLAQLGFTNPLNVAWEVLPFSFVYDWFQPIGPYLETLSAWHGLEFFDGYVVKFTRIERYGYLRYSGPSTASPPGLHEYYGEARGTGIRFDRIKLTTFPHQILPSFKNPISTIHAANALALVFATFKYA